jgi:hypothetical protein
MYFILAIGGGWYPALALDLSAFAFSEEDWWRLDIIKI